MKIVATANTLAARSTPHGFWRFAANYLLAARVVEVKIHEEGQLFFPTLQLYGITIELALKAFLLKRGLTLNEVRSLSHSLTKILSLARQRKLGREVRLDRREIAAIHVLDINYSSHRLRYIVTARPRHLNSFTSSAQRKALFSASNFSVPAQKGGWHMLSNLAVVRTGGSIVPIASAGSARRTLPRWASE